MMRLREPGTREPIIRAYTPLPEGRRHGRAARPREDLPQGPTAGPAAA